MDDCLFCRIAQKNLRSHLFWEDQDFIAILDIYPNCRGQALLLPKTHVSSDPAECDPVLLQKMMGAAQQVMERLKKTLGVYRVACVLEGMGVNHLHLKLYPLHGLDPTWRPHIPTERVWLDRYPGYITTHLGPAADPEELGKLANQLSQKAQEA